MLFEQLLNRLNALIAQPLFALDAHLKMAPLERVQYLQNYDYSVHNPKSSAVLSLFYPKNDQAYLLLIVRSSYPGVHSSQIAFPGGKRESGDIDLKHTALRETNEEVGVKMSEINIVKQWSIFTFLQVTLLYRLLWGLRSIRPILFCKPKRLVL